jgi:hypothetical protein
MSAAAIKAWKGCMHQLRLFLEDPTTSRVECLKQLTHALDLQAPATIRKLILRHKVLTAASASLFSLQL